jgi:hypothetical protein
MSRDVDTSTAKSYHLFWDQMTLPEEYPIKSAVFDNHFKLPTEILTSINKEPAAFKTISRLNYDMLPLKEKSAPTHYHSDLCSCIGTCTSSCFNALSRIECTAENCNVGGMNCGNRPYNFPKGFRTQRYFDVNMGWGLKALESIPAGELVIEYIGEVIDDNETKRRLVNQRKFSPTDHAFYIMELGRHRDSSG